MSRATDTVRYASRTTGVNFEKWLTWGVIGAGAYLLWKVYSVGSAASRALTSTGEAIGSGLYDVFHRDPLGETTFYIVKFPDGKNHSVPSRSVGNDGQFVNANLSPNYPGDGRTYRIVIERATGAKTAVFA